MKTYVKLTQDQVDQVRGLVDSKNDIIDELEARLKNTLNAQYVKMIEDKLTEAESKVLSLEENQTKLYNELDELDELLESRDGETAEKLERMDTLYAKCTTKIQELTSDKKSIEYELELQQSMNKKAIEMLNELSSTGSTLKKADLSNILDVNV